MSEYKKSKSIILIGSYLICIGIAFGLFGLSAILSRVEIFPYMHRGTVGRMASLTQDAKDHKFKSELERNKYLSEYNDLEKINARFLSKSISVQHNVFKVCLILISSILVVFSGVLILRRSKSGIKFINLGFYGLTISYVYIFLDIPYYMFLQQSKLVRIMDIIAPNLYKNPFFSDIKWIFSFVIIPIFVLIFLCLIYKVLPHRFLNRPNIKSQLT